MRYGGLVAGSLAAMTVALLVAWDSTRDPVEPASPSTSPVLEDAAWGLRGWPTDDNPCTGLVRELGEHPKGQLIPGPVQTITNCQDGRVIEAGTAEYFDSLNYLVQPPRCSADEIDFTPGCADFSVDVDSIRVVAETSDGAWLIASPSDRACCWTEASVSETGPVSTQPFRISYGGPLPPVLMTGGWPDGYRPERTNALSFPWS
jgi:hypothetical protein